MCIIYTVHVEDLGMICVVTSSSIQLMDGARYFPQCSLLRSPSTLKIRDEKALNKGLPGYLSYTWKHADPTQHASD